MTNFLVSPTEPALIKSLGIVSSVPEKHGADVFWTDATMGGFVGIQRKEIDDLLKSIQSGVLARELQKLLHCKLAILIVEGEPHFTPDGQLSHRFIRFTRTQYRSQLRSVQLRGIIVEHSSSTADTVALIESIARWVAKGEHRSLDRRPKPSNLDSWGVLTNKAWASHLLQSIEGIGPAQAEAIFDHFDGKLPIEFTATVAQLMEVPRIGKRRAEMIVRSFGGAL